MLLLHWVGRKWPLILLTVVIAAGSFLVVQRTLSAQQQRVPFMATVRETSYMPSGQVDFSQEVFFAARSDGSTVRGRNLEAPDKRMTGQQRWVFDLAHAEEFSVDGLTESISTVPLLKVAVEEHKRVPSCPGEAVPSRILGYDVVRNISAIDPAGRIRKEEIRAPALNCYRLKVTITIGNTDAESYVAKISEVTGISLGEPTPALFVKPAGYTERSPSQRRTEFYRRYPQGGCPSCIVEADKRSDEAYHAKQSNRGR